MPHLRSSEFRSTCLRCLESTFFSKASLKITVNIIKHCTFKRQGNEDQRLSVSPTWSRPAHVRYPSWFHAFPAHDWENEISKVSLSLWISDWSEGKWEIKISSTWSWIWLIPSPFLLPDLTRPQSSSRNAYGGSRGWWEGRREVSPAP